MIITSRSASRVARSGGNTSYRLVNRGHDSLGALCKSFLCKWLSVVHLGIPCCDRFCTLTLISIVNYHDTRYFSHTETKYIYITITKTIIAYYMGYIVLAPLRWRHNDHAGVSNHQPHGCLLNRLFRRKSKKTSKLRVTGLCAGNSPGTGVFPAQMASYAENVSIWWRHHV